MDFNSIGAAAPQSLFNRAAPTVDNDHKINYFSGVAHQVWSRQLLDCIWLLYTRQRMEKGGWECCWGGKQMIVRSMQCNASTSDFSILVSVLFMFTSDGFPPSAHAVEWARGECYCYGNGVFVTTRRSASTTINCFISMIKRNSFSLGVRVSVCACAFNAFAVLRFKNCKQLRNFLCAIY